MTPLDEALSRLTPGEVLRRLAAYLGKPAPHLHSESDGSALDFRPGSEEKNEPSLSYRAGDGGPVFTRFGGDFFEGGAVALLESVGMTKGEAARLLISWAGVQDEAPQPGERKKPAARPTPGGKLAEAVAKDRAKLEKLAPLPEEEKARALRGFVRITAEEGTPEAEDLAARGLLPAVAAGALLAYRWAGQVGEEGQPKKLLRLPGQFRPGVVVFESTGPDGQAWGLRGRNPGTKEELKASKGARYATFKGMHSAPWCGPRATGEGVRFLIVEGELNAAACWVMLEAAKKGAGHIQPDSRAEGWEVQGVPSVTALPHVAHIPAGAQVYIYADPDEEGEKAREKWGALLAAQGAAVFQVGQTAKGVYFPFWDGKGQEETPKDDACDALAPDRVGEFSTPEIHAAYIGQARLLDAIEKAKPWKPKAAAKKEGQRDGQPEEGQGEAGDVWETKRRGYGVRHGKLCALTVKRDEETGEDYEAAEVLADFTARIVAEVLEEDGSGEPRRVFHIEGHRPDGAPLLPPVVTVPTADFSGMAWPVSKWGGAARIPSGNGKKDKARDAVQVLSNAAGYPLKTVFQHTGWIQDPERGPLYLTAGAVIGAAGGVEGVAVDLPGRLAAYALPDPAKAEAADVRASVRASLDLLTLAPDAVAVPLLGAAYRSALGPSDFVLWIVGETGKHKTAFMGLVMAHYGAKWSRRFLPDGWASSANSLEVNAFRVKDALFVIDDFKPQGGASERAKMDATAGRIIQGAADGAGRGTLTADRRSRAGLWPRGTVATSAEDLPRGHSNRARLVIVEVHRRLIDSPAKSAAFFDGEEKAAAGVYALALASFVQAVAGSFDEVSAGSPRHTARVRQLAPHFQGAHGRTGDAAAQVAYGWECFLSFAVAVGAITEAEGLALWGRVCAALSSTAEGQGAHLAEADPVGRALGILSELLAQGRIYLEDLKGGPVPDEDAALCGYELHRYKGPDGEEESHRPRRGADLLGYYSRAGANVWGHFLPEVLHATLQRAAGGQGGAALPDPSKLWGNMRDKLHGAGLMKCEVDGQRVRATAKATGPDGVRRQFITLRLPLDGSSNSVGTVGTVGTDSPLSMTSTASGAVPTINFYSFKVGTVGTVRGLDPASSSPSSPPDPASGQPAEDGKAWEVEV